MLIFLSTANQCHWSQLEAIKRHFKSNLTFNFQELEDAQQELEKLNEGEVVSEEEEEKPKKGKGKKQKNKETEDGDEEEEESKTKSKGKTKGKKDKKVSYMIWNAFQ